MCSIYAEKLIEFYVQVQVNQKFSNLHAESWSHEKAIII
jgi:hypothetical protein